MREKGRVWGGWVGVGTGKRTCKSMRTRLSKLSRLFSEANLGPRKVGGSQTFREGVRNWVLEPLVACKHCRKKTLPKGFANPFPESLRTPHPLRFARSASDSCNNCKPLVVRVPLYPSGGLDLRSWSFPTKIRDVYQSLLSTRDQMCVAMLTLHG